MDLPILFKESIQNILQQDYSAFEQSLNTPQPVSIRLNPFKSNHCQNYLSLCHQYNLEIESPINWCKYGYYLKSRPSFTADPLFHCGCYYVQEASSMFISHILKNIMPDAPLHILDLCAAPGGKSTLILSEMPANSLLFANEINPSRCHILCENIIKWGNPNVIVTNNNAEDYKRSKLLFDVILCDAPCSGEGMFRKDNKAIDEWSSSNVVKCSTRQRDILSTIWDNLRPGGFLIYSTCTYNTSENEFNARFIRDELGGKPLSFETDKSWGIDTTNYLSDTIPVYRFFPHKTKGEGFFACCFRKEDSTLNKNSLPGKKIKSQSKNQCKCPPEYFGCIDSFNDYYYSKDSAGNIYAIKMAHQDLNVLAERHLNVKHKGICLCNPKGNKLRPAQSLAVSIALKNDFFPIKSIDISTALSYLKCESLQLDNSPKGYVLLTYKDHPIGFVNNIGSRANNMYPQEWRIRHIH